MIGCLCSSSRLYWPSTLTIRSIYVIRCTMQCFATSHELSAMMFINIDVQPTSKYPGHIWPVKLYRYLDKQYRYLDKQYRYLDKQYT